MAQSDAGRANGNLSREAERLLACLGAGGRAVPDPTDPGYLIVARRSASVTLGGGRFRKEAGEALLRADLAQAASSGSGGALVASEAGLAHLRRGGLADGFQDQHRDLVDARLDRSGIAETVKLNASESPLEWLRRRRDGSGNPLLPDAAYEAGQRFRRDLTLSQILPSISANWNLAGGRAPSGAPRDPAAAADATVAARQRVREACAAVGADFADLLIDLCGFLKPLAEIERARDWPQRSGKVVVRIALSRLAEHYGLGDSASGPAASRGIRVWQEREPLCEGSSA